MAECVCIVNKGARLTVVPGDIFVGAHENLVLHNLSGESLRVSLPKQFKLAKGKYKYKKTRVTDLLAKQLKWRTSYPKSCKIKDGGTATFTLKKPTSKKVRRSLPLYDRYMVYRPSTLEFAEGNSTPGVIIKP